MMAQQHESLMNNARAVGTHYKLRKVTEAEFRQNAAQFMRDADAGIQTVVVSDAGKVRTVIGLNGCRYLPDPTPDPLDELLQIAVEMPAAERRK
jgi:hypothetical protein